MPTRGCGERIQGGLYLTVPTSPNGMSVEWFLVDPAIPWKGGTLRGPELFSLPGEKVKHVALGVGASFYPWIPDYVEEVRVLGVSKRVPLSVNLNDIIPGESKLLLMHPRAIPEFDYDTFVVGRRYRKGDEQNPRCPKENPKKHLCLGDLWPLSAQPEFSSEKHQVTLFGSDARVKTPSVTYPVNEQQVEIGPPMNFQAGIFLRFPTFGFQFVSKSDDVPRKVAEKFESSEFELEVVEE